MLDDPPNMIDLINYVMLFFSVSHDGGEEDAKKEKEGRLLTNSFDLQD